jgi:predicted amidohydrolase
MRLALIQYDIVHNNPTENIRKAQGLIDQLPACDVIVLPETFNSAFIPADTSKSIESAEESLSWMKQTSRRKDSAICTTMFIMDEGHIYNSMFFVTPGGEVNSYKKRHLFLGEEKDNISAGTSRVIVNFRGWRINLLICYDLRFPVWSRNINDYDMIIYSANWPEPRVDAWKILLKARAIENQCYVAGVNRIGTDNQGIRFSGESMVADPYGRVIVDLKADVETVGTVILDREKLLSFREAFPAWRDADNFQIIT